MADITYQVVPHAASRQKIGDGDALLAYPAPDGGWAFQELETDKSNSRL